MLFIVYLYPNKFQSIVVLGHLWNIFKSISVDICRILKVLSGHYGSCYFSSISSRKLKDGFTIHHTIQYTTAPLTTYFLSVVPYFLTIRKLVDICYCKAHWFFSKLLSSLIQEWVRNQENFSFKITKLITVHKLLFFKHWADLKKT